MQGNRPRAIEGNTPLLSAKIAYLGSLCGALMLGAAIISPANAATHLSCETINDDYTHRAGHYAFVIDGGSVFSSVEPYPSPVSQRPI